MRIDMVVYLLEIFHMYVHTYVGCDNIHLQGKIFYRYLGLPFVKFYSLNDFLKSTLYSNGIMCY